MKCDELKPIFIPVRGITGDTLLGVGYYPSNAVDEAIAELKCELSDARDDARSSRNLIDDKNEEIKELEDKVQQKDFFWDGCCFSKMGFKNTIDVANYVDSLKAENEKLKSNNRILAHSGVEKIKENAELARQLRATKRALYKALANWALSTLAWLDCIDQGEPAKWSEMRRKCLSKVEEYK